MRSKHQTIKPFDLQLIFQPLHGAANGRLGQAQLLALSFEGPGEELNVQVDTLNINQVVRNLLHNAMNHTRDW